MKKFNLKTYLPYGAAVVLFLIITFVYFSPLLEGKHIIQSDIIHFTGVSKEIVDFRTKTGQEPLWTNSMFGGMPAYQISVKYTSNLIGYLDYIFTLGLPHPANIVFLYFLGFFILLLVMKVDPWLSIAGAVAFAFSSYFFIIIDAGHNSQAHAIGYMAPVIAGIILTLRGKYIWGGILSAIFLSLEVKANHPQITYYLAIIVLILGIVELVDALRNKTFISFLKSVGVLVIALVFTVLTNITSLWATYEYGKYTIRGKSELTTDKANKTSGLDKDYATQWSYGVGETLTLLIPNFYGGASAGSLGNNSELAKVLRANGQPEDVVRQFTRQPIPPLYWGKQPFTSPVYIGAIVFFLFILGLLVVKGSIKWWLFAATLLSIALSWGHNFMALTEFFLNYIPGYNKFRAVTMILVIAELTMPLLGVLAVKEMFNPEKDKKKLFKALQIAFYIVGGICLLFIIFPGIFLNFVGPHDMTYAKQYELPDWFIQAVRDDRKNMVVMDALRSFIFITLSAGVIWAVIFKKIKPQIACFAMIALILVDLFAVDKRYLNNDAFTSKSKVDNPFIATSADEQILKDSDPDFRVLNLTVDPFMEAGTSYFHKSIGGYHGAKFRRYQELIENNIQKEISEFAKTMNTAKTPVINMLNTKYFIVPVKDNQSMSFLNQHALGNAWFVQNVKLVDNADAEIKAVADFIPDSLAIVDKRFSDALQGYSPGRDPLDYIRLDTYAPNRLDYHYRSRNDGLAVFSEIYYPKGWNAYIDGKLTPHFRADYILRAMVLPAGDHKVVFRFEPKIFYVGEKISLISSIVLIIVILLLAFFEYRKANKTPA